jgi:hypothetical protein
MQGNMQANTASGNIESLRNNTQTYRRIIYVMCFITLAFGVTTMAVAANKLDSNTHSGETIVVPIWAVRLGVAIGTIITAVSLLGICGAWRAPEYIQGNQRNWPLTIFYILLVMGLALELAIAGVLLSKIGVIDGARSQSNSDAAVIAFDKDVTEFCLDNPNNWKDVQNYFGCCGYNSTNILNDPTATGLACFQNTTNPAVPVVKPCRQQLLENAKNSAITIAALSIVFAFLQTLSFFSACCLLCCFKPTYQ